MPTLREQATFAWSAVQNQDQRRADLLCSRDGLKVDASTVSDPQGVKEFQDAQRTSSPARSAAGS